MGRRGKGEGSIRQRPDGRWEARVSAPGAFGSQRLSIYGATRADVVERLAALQRDVRSGMSVADSRQLYRDYLAHWLEVKRPQLSESSYDNYASVIRLHIELVVGAVRMADLAPAHIERVYARMLSAGRTNVNIVRAALTGSLRIAERHGLVARNVAALVDAPRRAKRAYEVYSPEQAREYIAAARQLAANASAGDASALLLIVALMTGMRCGELCALRWSDVELRAARGAGGLTPPSLQVRRTFRWRHGDPVFAERPKTSSSIRRVMLAPQAVEALTLWHVAQRQQRLLAGPSWRTSTVGVSERHVGQMISFDGLICTDAVGLPWRNHVVGRLHQRIIRAAHLPLTRPHDLRHTCASLLLGAGVNPKVVAEMLGHASVQMTLNIYSHVLPFMQVDAIKTLGHLLTESAGAPQPSEERERKTDV
jgi:integrase